MIALALYQPDIPQNAGTMLRLCACLGVEAHLIEPAGFDASERTFRRSGMDYLGHVRLLRHHSWDHFARWRQESGRRLLLLTTKGDTPYTAFPYASGDILMMGRETVGVPDAVHAAADARLVIPMQGGFRSLNVATAAAMVMGEALRQTGGFSG